MEIVESVKENTPSSKKRTRWLRWLLWRPFLIALILIWLGISTWGTLQTRWGSDQFRKFVVGQLNEQLNGTLTIGRVDGSYWDNISAQDITIWQNGEAVVKIKEIQAAYKPLDLLGGTLHITNLYVRNPEIIGRQNPDSTWNLLGLLKPQPETGNTSQQTILVDRFRITDGQGKLVVLKNPVSKKPPSEQKEADRTVSYQQLVFEATGLLYKSPGFSGDVQKFGLVARLPEQKDDLALNFSGNVTETSAHVRNFSLISGLSRVIGKGYVALPQKSGHNSSNFHLQAQPFSFRELAPFAPFLDPEESLQGELQLSAPSGVWRAQTSGSFKKSGSWELLAEADLREPAKISVIGTVEKLNLAYLTAMESYASDLTGQVNAQLSGKSLQSLNGAYELVLQSGGRWQNYVLKETILKGDAQEGKLTFLLNTGLGPGTLSATGTIRPFDDVPTYDLTGNLAQVDPAVLDPTFDFGQFGGKFSLRGQGFDPKLASLSGQLNLLPTAVKYPPYRIDLKQTKAVFSYNQGAGQFEVSSGLGSGFIATKGRIKMVEDLQYQIEQGSLRHFDPRDVFGEEAPPGDINAQFSLDGNGTTPANLNLTVKADLQPSRFDIYNVRQGNLSASFANGVLKYTTNATIGQSRFLLTGSGKPFDKTPVFSISDGQFSDLNLDDFVLDQSLDTRLNGRFTASVIGTNPKTMTISSAFAFGPSRFRTYQIEGFKGNVALAQNLLRYNVELHSAFGDAVLKGQAHPFDHPLSAKIEDGRFSAVNLAALTAEPKLQSYLNGQIEEAYFSGATENDLRGRLSLKLTESRFNRETIRRGQLVLEGNAQKVEYQLHLNPENGLVKVMGVGGLQANEPYYQVQGDLENISLAKWLNMPDTVNTRLNLNLAAEGRGISLETMQLTGKVSAKNSYWDTVRLQTGLSKFKYQEGMLHLDTLSVESNLGTLAGRGPLAVYDNLIGGTSDMQFSGYIKTLTPLSGLVGAKLTGRGAVRGNVRGEVNAWRIRLDTVDEGLGLLGYDDIHIGRARGRLAVEFEAGVPVFQTRSELENVSIPGYVFESATLEVGLRDSVASFGGKFTLDERLSGSGDGTLYLRSNGVVVDLASTRLDIGGKRWQMEKPTQFIWDKDQLGLKGFLLVTDGQKVVIEGGLFKNNTGTLKATVEKVDITAIADILKFPKLGGVLSGDLEVRGTIDTPLMDGSLILSQITSAGKPVGEASAKLNYQDNRLNIDMRIRHNEGQDLLIGGFLPFNLGQLAKPLSGPVDLRLNTDRFNLDWANPFLDDTFMRDLKGRTTGNVTIGGTFDAPDFRGNLSIRNTQFGLPFLGIQYSDAEADVVFNGDIAQVQKLYVRTAKGNLKGNGTISLSQLNLGYLDLALEADGFQMIRDNTFRVTATGKASLKGTTSRPILDGDVVLNECDVQLNAELMQSARETIQLSQEDLREVEARFGKQANIADTSTVTFYDATDVKLRVRSNGNAWLRSRYNPRMDIEMTGDLEFRKPYRGAEVVVGRLKAVPGRSRVEFGRRFDLTTGDILFNGDMLNPIMNISATYKANAGSWGDEQSITMEISGDVNNANFRFASNPPMEDTEILSYLAFGKPAQSAFALDNGIVGDLLSTYGYNLVESLLSQRVQESGLADVVELTSSNGEPSLKIGKYISRRFFIALDSKILGGTGGSGFLLEYQAQKWALLRIQQFPSTNDLQERTLGLYVLLEYAY